jgi:hypothetical protein
VHAGAEMRTGPREEEEEEEEEEFSFYSLWFFQLRNMFFLLNTSFEKAIDTPI